MERQWAADTRASCLSPAPGSLCQGSWENLRTRFLLPNNSVGPLETSKLSPSRGPGRARHKNTECFSRRAPPAALCLLCRRGQSRPPAGGTSPPPSRPQANPPHPRFPFKGISAPLIRPLGGHLPPGEGWRRAATWAAPTEKGETRRRGGGPRLPQPSLTGAEAKRQLPTKFFAPLSYKKAGGGGGERTEKRVRCLLFPGAGDGRGEKKKRRELHGGAVRH